MKKRDSMNREPFIPWYSDEYKGPEQNRWSFSAGEDHVLHLEYGSPNDEKRKVEIHAEDVMDVPGLRNMIMHDFLIDNPAKTFAEKYRAGGYERYTEEETAAEAEVANVLSDFWEGKAAENAMLLLSRMMQAYAKMRLGHGRRDGNAGRRDFL